MDELINHKKLIKFLMSYLNYTASSNIPLTDVVSSILVLSLPFLVFTDNKLRGGRRKGNQGTTSGSIPKWPTKKAEEYLHLFSGVRNAKRLEGKYLSLYRWLSQKLIRFVAVQLKPVPAKWQVKFVTDLSTLFSRSNTVYIWRSKFLGEYMVLLCATTV